jgi:hypothetical protein
MDAVWHTEFCITWKEAVGARPTIRLDRQNNLGRDSLCYGGYSNQGHRKLEAE